VQATKNLFPPRTLFLRCVLRNARSSCGFFFFWCSSSEVPLKTDPRHPFRPSTFFSWRTLVVDRVYLFLVKFLDAFSFGTEPSLLSCFSVFFFVFRLRTPGYRGAAFFGFYDVSWPGDLGPRHSVGPLFFCLFRRGSRSFCTRSCLRLPLGLFLFYSNG